MNFYTLTFKKYSNKQFIKYLFIIVFCLINIVAAINYYIDPLRMFSHHNTFNQKQVDFNERQQKTNYLKYINNDFSSVMLGSSRTTYINQYDFQGYKLFNYAANQMSPYEYHSFLYNFTKITKKQPKYIILGVDFFGTSVEKNINYPKEKYLINTQDPFYRLKSLYNIQLVKHSIKNIRQMFNANKPFYSRNNIKTPPKTYKINNLKDIKRKINKYKNYKYDSNYKEYLISLKNTYKDSKFIIFSTPVTNHQLLEYEKNGYLNSYFHWLNDLVDVFGEINHFMYPNAITKDTTYFFDANHIYPKTGKLIAKFISSKVKYKNFGIILNKKNIQKFIQDYPKYK